VLKEGEVACFQIDYASPRTNANVPSSFVFGLRNNRPVWRTVSNSKAFTTHWAEDMRMDKFGDWDLVMNSILSYPRWSTWHHLKACIEAKKRRKGSKLQWILTIAIFYCTCHASERSWEVCACYLETDELEPIRASTREITSLETITAKASCAECGRSIQPRKALEFANNRDRQPRTLTCDECCQLIAKCGMHYLECPCSVCGLESMVERVVGLA
jgi:hypothetical protein